MNKLNNIEGIQIELYGNLEELKQQDYHGKRAYVKITDSLEQIFTEKLRSILKFGARSTRYKDIFDLYWLSDQLNTTELLHCFDILIFSDSGMKENTISEIERRIRKVLENQDFRKLLSSSKKNWLDTEDDKACDGILSFLESLV